MNKHNPTGLYQDLISPAQGGSVSSDLDGEDFEVKLARARGKARSDGFADGAASAEASFDRDLSARIDAIAKALDQVIAEESARDLAAMAMVQQIIERMLKAFAPKLAHAALPDQVADAVAGALRANVTGSIIVEVNADRIADIQTALAQEPSRITFNACDHLATGVARVEWQGGFDQIDPAAAIAEGIRLLEEKLTSSPSPQTAADGQNETPSEPPVPGSKEKDDKE